MEQMQQSKPVTEFMTVQQAAVSWTDRQRQTDRELERGGGGGEERDKQTDRQDRQRQTDRQRQKDRERQTDRDTQTDRDRQADRDT